MTTEQKITGEEMIEMLGDGPRVRVVVSRYHEGQIVSPSILARYAGRKNYRVVAGWYDASDQCTYLCGAVNGTRDECEAWLREQGFRAPDIGAV